MKSGRACAISAISGTHTAAQTERSAIVARPSRWKIMSAKAALLAETKGRVCLCNGLVATIGLAQVRSQTRAGRGAGHRRQRGRQHRRLFAARPRLLSAADVIRKLQGQGV